MQIYRILQIYSILNLVVFRFILREGEVLEKAHTKMLPAGNPKGSIKYIQVKTFCLNQIQVVDHWKLTSIP